MPPEDDLQQPDDRPNPPAETISLPVEDEVIDLAAAAEQPTRSGRKRPPRRFDQTQLHAAHHGKYVHRDYLAHAFRWGWVSRHLDRDDRVLDVGCGQELPLMHVLSGSKSLLPSLYLGVDLNSVPFSGSPKWARVLEKFSFVDDYEKLAERIPEAEGGFNKIVNFEVIEHVSAPDQLTLLKGMRHWLKDDGLLYLSTPVFNGFAAVNHVKELTIPELQALFDEAGFEIVRRFGTFISAQDIKRVALGSDWLTYQSLLEYYGHDVMATFLAPLYPDDSRNNLWVAKKRTS
jgi:2-polyprenyl-3-methyl-5-hydroxy-6-metoxy-1,4-benzoquinol methylase